MAESDRLRTAAESGLHSLNGQADSDDGIGDREVTALDLDAVGYHVDDPDAEIDDPLEGRDGGGGRDALGAVDDALAGVAGIDSDVVDAIAEAFNARDLDALLDVVAADGEAPGLLGGGRDGLAEAIESLWHRRPSASITRGRVHDVVVGVLWEHDGRVWWPLATVHVDDLDDDGHVGVLEFSDDPSLLDEVEVEGPDDDLEEGARWEEWDDGSA